MRTLLLRKLRLYCASHSCKTPCATGRLFRFIKDDDLQVRKRVAERLLEVSLGLMINDSSPNVRRIVAERMSADDAVLLLHDCDWVVRYSVRYLLLLSS